MLAQMAVIDPLGFQQIVLQVSSKSHLA
jgi:ribosomal protein L20